MRIITTRPSAAVYVKNPRSRGGHGESMSRRRNSATASPLVRLFDAPKAIVNKVTDLPLVKRIKLLKKVPPLVGVVTYGLGASAILLAAAHYGMKMLPDNRIGDTIRRGGFFGVGVLGALGTMAIPSGKVFTDGWKKVISGAMIVAGTAITAYRFSSQKAIESGDMDGLGGLAIDGDMGAPGPAYDIIPASAADPYHGLAVQEYDDASMMDAMQCPSDMADAEADALAYGGWRDWFGRFRTGPRRTTQQVGAASRHCGLPGHRWGWMVKAIGPERTKAVAQMDADERQEAIAAIKAAAVKAAEQQMQQMQGLALDMGGLAIDPSQAMGAHMGLGNLAVTGAVL